MIRTENKKDNKLYNRFLYALIIGIIIFIPSFIFGLMHQLSGLQLSIFRFINNGPNYFKEPSLIITEALGAGYAIAAVVLIPIILRYYRLAWRFFFTVGGAGLVMEIVKFIVKEPRPVVLLHGNLHERAIESGLNSFPSGHQTVATAMALTLCLILPGKWKWLSIVWIIVVAISRVYLGVHTPNDIIGGFAIGLISVAVVYLLPNNIAKKLYLENDKLLNKHHKAA